MSMPLLQTKLYAPPSRTTLLHRPLLTAQFNARGLRPLTLIAAPAGFGKSTLVSAWIAQREACVAWLALDEDDNDIGRFLTYLLAALRTVGPVDLGAGVLALLQSPQTPPLRALLATLAHELSANLPACVLVLDDYHVINAQPIHDTLIFLLEHVPALRWIITTRADPPLPLGRLRARGQLLELRSADLRFTPAETAQFFNEVMQIVLPPEAVQKLAAHTEGWVTGLQLAALAMQNSPDRAAFIRDFSGSHRYVADYLADEVLSQLPAATQHFLLHTSILERMCAELCAAILCEEGEETLASQSFLLAHTPTQPILEELERTNLFLIPLDGERRWYRYHQLFADLLQQRLQRRHPQLASELHRRAARWFAQHGLIEDAIRHTITGQDFAQAADLLEQHHETFWMQGRFVTLQHWLAALPDAVKQPRPRLLLALAWTHFLTDSPAATLNALLQAAETAIVAADATRGMQQSPTTTELLGVLAAIRAAHHSKQEDIASIIAAAQQALADLPPTIGSWRSVALMCLGFAYQMNGSVRAAERTLDEAIQLCQDAGNHYSAVVGTMSLARSRMMQGRLHAAAATYTQGLAQAAQKGMQQLSAIAQAHINLGRLHYEWNELALAEQQLQTGLAQLQGQVGSWVQFEGYILLARVKQTQGDVANAFVLLNQAEQVAQTIPFQWTKGVTAAFLAYARLRLGHAEEAYHWLAQVPTPLTDDLNRVREGTYLIAARVLLAQDRAAEALPLFVRITQAAATAGRMKVVVESCVLEALAHHALADHGAAWAALYKALTLAAPEGYIRTFVDEGEMIWQIIYAPSGLPRFTIHDSNLHAYADRILAACGELGPFTNDRGVPPPLVPAIVNRKSQIAKLIEPLSDRELELLHLMAAGFSNQEIADRLFITLGTVKSHANHIFGKLGVQGRVKAINRARELALI